MNDIHIMYCVCGCNGAGKTTVYRKILQNSEFTDIPVVDPDRIAVENNCNSIEAGKLAIKKISDYITRKQSFIKESTLTSNYDFSILEKAKAMGFSTILYYVCLNSWGMHYERVQARVRSGGHDIPKDIVRHRYDKSLLNLQKAIGLFDEVFVYDNSEDNLRFVAAFKHSNIIQFDFCPPWFIKIAEQYNIDFDSQDDIELSLEEWKNKIEENPFAISELPYDFQTKELIEYAFSVAASNEKAQINPIDLLQYVRSDLHSCIDGYRGHWEVEVEYEGLDRTPIYVKVFVEDE